jgi:alkylated DNA repair protein (DNA oxidative demethylase)
MRKELENLRGFFDNKDGKGKYMTVLRLRGFDIYKAFLDPVAQQAVLGDIRSVVKKAPFFRPETPGGKKMSVRMTSAGQYGWFSDADGYRYADQHPNGTAWPAIPETVLSIWNALTGLERKPECCLINYYASDAKMGMHQDRDEADFRWPVVSVSLGDEALFRIGGQKRGGKTDSLWLQSGDVVVMGGEARLNHHGVDRVRAGSSKLLPKGGRINLTMRVVK